MWDIEKIDKPEWLYGIAGNITKSHYDENGILRYGTREFRAGTKIYLANWATDDGRVLAIGLSRKRRNKRRKFIEEFVDVKHIENLRLTRIFNTAVIEKMLFNDGFGPFPELEKADDKIIISYLSDYYGYWGNTEKDKTEIVRFIEMMKDETNHG